MKLGEICETSAGGTPLKSEKEYYAGGDIPWLLSGEVNSKNITLSKNFITRKGLDNSSAKVFPPNTVLVAMYGATAGQVGILRFHAATNQAVCGILPNDRVIPEYLYYFLLSKKSTLVAQAVGNAQPNISQQKIRNTEIELPPLIEQKRIVAMLDEAFEDIDKARELTEQNLKNARELFESYLHQAFLPENHWETNTLSNICQIKPPKKEAREVLTDTDKVSFVPMDCLGISQKELQLKHERTLREVAGSYTYFGEGDVLLAKITPCFENGKLGIARGLTNRIGFGSSEFIVFRCSDKIAPDYLYYYLSRQRFIEEGQPLMTGAVGHKRVSKDFIENYSISYPALSEQKQIYGRLDKARTEINRIVAIYETKLDYLNELRNSLLANTFSGKLKIA